MATRKLDLDFDPGAVAAQPRDRYATGQALGAAEFRIGDGLRAAA